MKKLLYFVILMMLSCFAGTTLMSCIDNDDDNNILYPDIFAAEMQNITENPDWDTENIHIHMDNLMSALLRKLGYGKAMDIYDKEMKWYA